MQVLKFGGTSVANAQNISLVKNIVSNVAQGNVIVVVSALGGVTDLLLKTASLASEQNAAYLEKAKEIEARHIETIKEIIPIKQQSKVLSMVKSELNNLETLLEGAYLIGEITPKLSDKIVSYGELLSSYIISEYFISEGLASSYKDSRELI
ncbi:MAG: bifunctional aspartate kinase/homoserine dehydrogenase I, partial [Flavobacteriales bacterium]